jgi:hypothetical protein
MPDFSQALRTRLTGVGNPLLDLLGRHFHDPVVLVMHPLAEGAEGLSGEPVKTRHEHVPKPRRPSQDNAVRHRHCSSGIDIKPHRPGDSEQFSRWDFVQDDLLAVRRDALRPNMAIEKQEELRGGSAFGKHAFPCLVEIGGRLIKDRAHLITRKPCERRQGKDQAFIQPFQHLASSFTTGLPVPATYAEFVGAQSPIGSGRIEGWQ